MSLTSRPLPEITDDDHTLGMADAPLTLVEYGDFECPVCGEAYPVVEQIIEHYGDRLRFVYRNFPLGSVHPHAQLAAEATEAAAVQGQFWPMHHKLYENQKQLERADLEHYADELGLDIDEFRAALDDGIYTKQVKDGFRAGVRAGANGTPTFFINGQRYPGENTFAAMSAAMDRAMSNKQL